VRLGQLTRSAAPEPLKDHAQEARIFRGRAKLAFLLVLLVVVLLGLRYVFLQVISHDEFATRSTSNQVRVVPVPPNRGLIYDRRGRPVAENRPAYRLELVPEKVGNLTACP
jgi:penicillin-binding protein 2